METTITQAEAQSVREIISNPVVGQDSRVSVSGTDQSMGYLGQKLVAGSNVTLTTINPGVQETLRVAATQQVPTPTGTDGRVLTENAGVAGWADPPAVPAETWQSGTLNFPINYATGTDPVAGTVFTSQAEIDAYLIANSITHFKHIMAVWEALPDHLTGNIYFQLATGVHRPRVGELSGKPFSFDDYPGRKKPTFHDESYISFQHGAATDYASWEVISAAQVCTASSTTNGNQGYEYYVEMGGAAYTPGAFKGYFARINTGVVPIRDNDATKIYLNRGWSGTAVGASISVVSPSAIIRNSFDDLVAAYNTDMFSWRNKHTNRTEYGSFWQVRIDQYAQSKAICAAVGAFQWDCYESLIDLARLRNEGRSVANIVALQQDSGLRGQWWKCGFRGANIATSAQSSQFYTQFPYGGHWTPKTSFALTQTYLGGWNNNTDIQAGVGIQLPSTCIEKCGSWQIYSGATINASTNGASALFKQATNHCLVFSGGSTGSLGGDFSLGNSPVDAVFENCPANIAVMSGFSRAYLKCRNGVVANGSGYAIQVSGPSAFVHFDSTHNVSCATGEIQIANAGAGDATRPLTYAHIAGLREAASQPGTTLHDVVRILDVSSGGTVGGNMTLAYLTSGTTLAYTAPGDTAGAPINVGAGGIFTLYSGTTSNWVVVQVIGALLPVGNVTEVVKLARATFNDSYRNILSKI